MSNTLKSLALIVFALAFGMRPAQAYLDPGTGSIILQAIIGAVAGGLVMIKLYWSRLKDFFNNRGKTGGSDSRNKDQ